MTISIQLLRDRPAILCRHTRSASYSIGESHVTWPSCFIISVIYTSFSFSSLLGPHAGCAFATHNPLRLRTAVFSEYPSQWILFAYVSRSLQLFPYFFPSRQTLNFSLLLISQVYELAHPNTHATPLVHTYQVCIFWWMNPWEVGCTETWDGLVTIVNIFLLVSVCASENGRTVCIHYPYAMCCN